MQTWVVWTIAGASAVVLGTTAFILISRNKGDEELETAQEGSRGEVPQDFDSSMDGGKPEDDMGKDDRNAYNLDFKDIRDKLESAGLDLSVDMNVKLSIEENGGSTGALWYVKPDTCAEILKITEEYKYREVFDEEGFPMAGAPGIKEFKFSAIGEGECTFEAVNAQEWNFNWETNPDEYFDKLVIPISVGE